MKPTVDPVVGRVADRDTFRRAVRVAGIVCTLCAPFTGSRFTDDAETIKVRESDLDLPAADSGWVRLVTCARCGRRWNPFTKAWEGEPNHTRPIL